ncbi:MAG: response regulator transcription factor [Acidobacteria bacterium]|nr:response regulator transcription factor [Acidobacteriota bacterium]
MTTHAEWRVLVADDEPAARRGVRQLLAAFPDFAVAAECRTGEEVLAALDAVRPHVTFLDIRMPGMDGFEVIRRRTPERMGAVVFLTAYDQFAIRAFEAQALDYLVKPVSEARFAATMQRLTRLLRGDANVPRIPVTTNRGVMLVPLSEIDWIEAAGNYAQLWVGTRSHLVRESLRELEQRVQGHGFLRAHRSALVRIACVRAIRAEGDGGCVAVLASGANVPISRRQRAAFVGAVRSVSS